MDARVVENNRWRREKIAALVAACRSDEFYPIERAALAVKLRAAVPSDVGFSVPDLRYYRAGLISRADHLQSVIERMGRRLESDTYTVRRTGRRSDSALADQLFAVYGAQLEAKVAALKAGMDQMVAEIASITVEIDSLRGAAALLSDIIDSRTVCRFEALPTVGPLPAEALA
jgi:hypothetical protein